MTSPETWADFKICWNITDTSQASRLLPLPLKRASNMWDYKQCWKVSYSDLDYNHVSKDADGHCTWANAEGLSENSPALYSICLGMMDWLALNIPAVERASHWFFLQKSCLSPHPHWSGPWPSGTPRHMLCATLWFLLSDLMRKWDGDPLLR